MDWGVLTGVILFATALVGLITRLTKKIDQVHVLVNDRMTKALKRIDQLHDALVEGDIDVPDPPARGDG